VELRAKILQIMRNDFKDYARTFLPIIFAFRLSKMRLVATSLVLLYDRVTCSITGHVTRRQLPPRDST